MSSAFRPLLILATLSLAACAAESSEDSQSGSGAIEAASPTESVTFNVSTNTNATVTDKKLRDQAVKDLSASMAQKSKDRCSAVGGTVKVVKPEVRVDQTSSSSWLLQGEHSAPCTAARGEVKAHAPFYARDFDANDSGAQATAVAALRVLGGAGVAPLTAFLDGKVGDDGEFVWAKLPDPNIPANNLNRPLIVLGEIATMETASATLARLRGAATKITSVNLQKQLVRAIDDASKVLAAKGPSAT